MSTFCICLNGDTLLMAWRNKEAQLSGPNCCSALTILTKMAGEKLGVSLLLKMTKIHFSAWFSTYWACYCSVSQKSLHYTLLHRVIVYIHYWRQKDNLYFQYFSCMDVTHNSWLTVVLEPYEIHNQFYVHLTDSTIKIVNSCWLRNVTSEKLFFLHIWLSWGIV